MSSDHGGGGGGRGGRKRGNAGGDAEHADERWLLTYADMITLLLVLFIVLFALSKVNEAKFRQFSKSFKMNRIVGVSLDKGTTTVAPLGPKPLSATPQELHRVEAELMKALRAAGQLQAVSFTITKDGLVEGLVADSTLFETDSADLSPLGQRIVDTSGRVLAGFGNNIEVAGYTDDQPINGGHFGNNWALSAARATTVVQELTTVDGVAPTRVFALAYGQYHPVATNSTPAGKSQNRRVNIVVKGTIGGGGAV